MSKECFNVFDEMYKRKKFTWSDAVKKGKVIAISGTVATDENHRTLYATILTRRCAIYSKASRAARKDGREHGRRHQNDGLSRPGRPRLRENGRHTRSISKRTAIRPPPGVVVHSLLRPDAGLLGIDFLAVVD